MRKLLVTIIALMWAAWCSAEVRNIQDNYLLNYYVLTSTGGHVAGQAPTVKVLKASSGHWLDFADSTFKASGWSSKSAALTEDAAEGRYYYLFNPPASETAADQYVFLVDNVDGTYGDHQSVTVAYQSIGTSTFDVATPVTVGTNNDKTGYALTQAFPTNFSSLSITEVGEVDAGTVEATVSTTTITEAVTAAVGDVVDSWSTEVSTTTYTGTGTAGYKFGQMWKWIKDVWDARLKR